MNHAPTKTTDESGCDVGATPCGCPIPVRAPHAAPVPLRFRRSGQTALQTKYPDHFLLLVSKSVAAGSFSEKLIEIHKSINMGLFEWQSFLEAQQESLNGGPDA